MYLQADIFVYSYRRTNCICIGGLHTTESHKLWGIKLPICPDYQFARPDHVSTWEWVRLNYLLYQLSVCVVAYLVQHKANIFVHSDSEPNGDDFGLVSKTSFTFLPTRIPACLSNYRHRPRAGWSHLVNRRFLIQH